MIKFVLIIFLLVSFSHSEQVPIDISTPIINALWEAGLNLLPILLLYFGFQFLIDFIKSRSSDNNASTSLYGDNYISFDDSNSLSKVTSITQNGVNYISKNGGKTFETYSSPIGSNVKKSDSIHDKGFFSFDNGKTYSEVKNYVGSNGISYISKNGGKTFETYSSPINLDKNKSMYDNGFFSFDEGDSYFQVDSFVNNDVSYISKNGGNSFETYSDSLNENFNKEEFKSFNRGEDYDYYDEEFEEANIIH